MSVRGLAGVGALVIACGGRPAEPRDEPASPVAELRVLGTAQDGGVPHAACSCERCEAARRDPRLARKVASLALVTDDGVRLVDASPDLPAQLEALRDVRDAPPGAVDRAPVDGILLTHAHVGHYLGLAWLGFEAIAAKGVPVHASERMEAFLRANAPWDQLVSQHDIDLQPLVPDKPVRFGAVEVTPIVVPHRDEYSDTLAFRFVGPNVTVLYVPDTEPWSRWPTPVEDALQGVDIALLDGTFFASDELPGRPVASIGHPLVVETMDRLEPLVQAGLRVYFTHLNHSNPALAPGSDARAQIERRGFAVLADGERFAL